MTLEEKSNRESPLATGDGGGRNARVDVRLTEAERDELRRRAELVGVTVSQLVRWCAIDGRMPTHAYDAAELRATRTELKRAGTNLNQLVRLLNTYGPNTGVPKAALEAALAEVRRAAELVSDALVAGR